MPDSLWPSVTRSMKPTTMADISRSRRSVVMSAIPDCFRICVFSGVIVKPLFIGIEIGHAAECDLRGQIGACVLSRGSRSGGGASTQVNVDRTNLVLVVGCRDCELVDGSGGRAIRK